MSHYFERVHSTQNEFETAYETHMQNREYPKAYEVALKGINLAESVTKMTTVAPYMRNIYAKHLEAWKVRAENAKNVCQTSAISPAADSGETTYKPAANTIKGDTTFEDIVGLDEAKEMLYDKVIMPLKHPEVIGQYKKKPSNTIQILLYGPPGTGKTMFAEAIANELDMSMHRCSAGEIIGSLLGESTRNMRAYMEGITQDPSDRILAFVDEFDALAGVRSGTPSGADGEMNRVVNELLQCLDAMVKTNQNKIIIFCATTNLPWNIDPAILRGKRLDTQIFVGLPDKKARRGLVQKYLGGGIPPLASDVDLDKVADDLKGYSPADIATICDKVSDEPLFRHYHTGKPACVTKQDIRKVCARYRPSVTEQELLKYTLYNKERGYDFKDPD
jgi:SpoVK/Ycf46/Vps4 family AAA+-type ATPase